MSARQMQFLDMEEQVAVDRTWMPVNRAWLIQVLEECIADDDISAVKRRIAQLRLSLFSHRSSQEALISGGEDGDVITFREDVLQSELDQITDSHTIQRAHYYIARLKASAERVQTGRINDINLLRWKEYDEIITDSLWNLKRRDNSGAHLGWYWGNFIPHIPHQMMLRYTKKGDWVLDPFAGSGTTLIECRRLGRNGIGVELNPKVADSARQLVAQERNDQGVVTDIIEGDSTALDFPTLLKERGIDAVQLLIMHPPYHDIIRFSDNARDLSTAGSVAEFLDMFGQVVERTYPVLENGRYLAVVIGDKYTQGEWVPLGFYTMQEVLRYGYTLKSIIVKNFEETRAKRQQQGLWRYRALVGGFYVFKHEYILLFRKGRRKGNGPAER